MAYYQSWFGRFVLRKDFFRRVNARLKLYSRRVAKDELDDLFALLSEAPPRTIFDGGANIGFVTHRFRTLFPSATVYAFEPNPVVYETLASTYAHDPQVKLFQRALSHTPGTLHFHQNNNSATSSLYEPTDFNRTQWARRSKIIDVEATSIDRVCQEQQLESIDILKLDLEGAECDALRGAETLLDAQRIHTIYTEIALVPLYKGQPLLEDLITYLRGKGYYLFNLYGFNESAIRQAVLGNATFISAKLRETLVAKHGSAQCGW